MLSKAERLLIAVTALYTLAATMVSTFANVYLLTYTKSLITMSIYALVRYGVLALAAVYAAKLSTKIKFSTVLLLGLINIILAVLTLLVVKDYIASHLWLVYLIGGIWGFGEGFFWITVNTLVQLVTSLNTRMRFIGINGALSNLVTVIAPFLSAIILKLRKIEIEGYYLLFLIAIILFFITAALAVFLNIKASGDKFSITNNLTSIRVDHAWRKIVIGQYLLGIRDAATIALAGLLIYMIVLDGSSYGSWLGIFAIIATLTQYLSGKIINQANLLMILILGSIGIFIGGSFLVLLPTMLGVILYGIIHNLSAPFCLNSFSIMAMETIGEYLHQENVVGRIASREILIGAGRVTGFLIVILINQFFTFSLQMEVAFILLYLSSLFFAYSMYRQRKV